MKLKDIVSIKCSVCGTMVADTVPMSELRSGTAVLTCHYCGQRTRLARPTWRGFFRHLVDPAPVELLLVLMLWSWLEWLRRNGDIAISRRTMVIITVAAAAIAFISTFIRIRRGSGRIRRPGTMRGLTPKTAIPVKSVREEFTFVDLQRCPQCHGTLRAGQPQLISSSRVRQFFAPLLGAELLRLADRIDVHCPSCSLYGSFFFDISDIPYVRELGVTEEMIQKHVAQSYQEASARER